MFVIVVPKWTDTDTETLQPTSGCTPEELEKEILQET